MPDQRRTGKQILLALARRIFVGVVVSAAIVYALDYVVLRARLSSHGNAFGTVTVRPVYAVPHKDRSTEYLVGDPQQQTCVHSLFPHLGDAPCWYLSGHTEQRIEM